MTSPSGTPEYRRQYYAQNQARIRAKNKANADAHIERTRASGRKRASRWVAANIDTHRAHSRDRERLARKNPVDAMKRCRRSAAVRGYAFSLTPDEYHEFWNKPCHYCGDVVINGGIDRIDNSVGYATGNCVPCCRFCNVAKNVWSLDEFVSKVNKISARHKPCIK